MTSSAPKSEPLRILYWRSEILRVVYWLYGEGLGDLVDMDLIRQYLGVDPMEDLSTYVNLLVADGSLVRDGEWYALSERGSAEGVERGTGVGAGAVDLAGCGGDDIGDDRGERGQVGGQRGRHIGHG